MYVEPEFVGAFAAPAQHGMVNALVAEYRQKREQIEQVAGLFKGDLGGVVGYFVRGNNTRNRSSYGHLSAEQIFKTDGAIAALNADYWSRALGLTDVRDCMPQKRRDEWDAAIQEMTTPDFEFETVKSTISGLLASRETFFAEKVDGVFRALSYQHVTNVPEGFGKRMILSGVVDDWGTVNYSRAGTIGDLRAVIAKFMGRDEPSYYLTSRPLKIAFETPGEWITLDGGVIRVRVYKKGTAHLEIHPDMVWRLNAVLASLHPRAIPSQFRTKPAKLAKGWSVIETPLPVGVLHEIAQYDIDGTTVKLASAFASSDKGMRQAVADAMRAIGGEPGSYPNWFEFDYNPADVLRHLVTTGCLPERKSYQYYPTPEAVASLAADLADIGDTDTVLEPSAGQGDLAAFLPADRTTCVDLATLNVEVLKAKGYRAVRADFLEWSRKEATRYDRVVMNPPFSQGRAVAHLEAAARMVKPGGRLVAILPASMRGKDALPGWALEWSDVIHNEFEGTGVSVVIASGWAPLL